jgi:hypothetical protein
MAQVLDKEKIMKRIAKLLNLSDEKKNNNEHEAQAALLKAQQMMAENNISTADLNIAIGDARKQEEAKKEVKEKGAEWTKLQWYHRAIADVIADNFRCYHFYRHSNGMTKMVFMGLAADAELANTMYEFALIALDYNADQYVKEQREVRYIRDSKGIKTDYMRGFIRGLHEKFEAQKEMKITQNILDEEGTVIGTTETSMALVLVKDNALEVAHKAMKFKTAKASKGGKQSAGDYEAFSAGKEKGKNFEAASGFIG